MLKLRRTLLLAPVGPRFPPKNLRFLVFFVAGDQAGLSSPRGPMLGGWAASAPPPRRSRTAWVGFSAAPHVPSALLPPSRGGELLRQPTWPTRTRRGRREQEPSPSRRENGGGGRASGGALSGRESEGGGFGSRPPVSVSAAERSTGGKKSPFGG